MYENADEVDAIIERMLEEGIIKIETDANGEEIAVLQKSLNDDVDDILMQLIKEDVVDIGANESGETVVWFNG